MQERHVHAATLQESHVPATGGPALPGAVLWDLDGTLVDSEPVWDVSLADTVRRLGGELSDRGRAAVLGSELDRAVLVLLAEAGCDATPELIDETRVHLVSRTAELFADGVVWQLGAREALDLVGTAGVPMALVTNSQRVLTELALDVVGRDRFAVSVCGDEVDRGKPAPDVYLRAAELLEVPIADCLAVEDSPTGALSAERAGAAVLVVPGEVQVPPGPRRTHRVGLTGLTLAELAAAANRVTARAGRPACALRDDLEGANGRAWSPTGRPARTVSRPAHHEAR
jgi:beta-phosphoglucomutase-like phosphatase (HAD superfamily)